MQNSQETEFKKNWISNLIYGKKITMFGLLQFHIEHRQLLSLQCFVMALRTQSLKDVGESGPVAVFAYTGCK